METATLPFSTLELLREYRRLSAQAIPTDYNKEQNVAARRAFWNEHRRQLERDVSSVVCIFVMDRGLGVRGLVAAAFAAEESRQERLSIGSNNHTEPMPKTG
jgi:hypothetical protein